MHDYTFTPWKIEDDKCIVSPEATWREPVKWDAKADYDRASANLANTLDVEVSYKRPRVLVTCDVFAEWDGPMMSSNGGVYQKCICGAWFIDHRDGTTHCPGTGSAPVKMDDCRRRLFQLIDETPHLDWMMVTECPENVGRLERVAGRPTSKGDA